MEPGGNWRWSSPVGHGRGPQGPARSQGEGCRVGEEEEEAESQKGPCERGSGGDADAKQGRPGRQSSISVLYVSACQQHVPVGMVPRW